MIVNVPLIGGGFGRRLQADYAVEAAQVSSAINAPVQVVWTRDDDLQHDFYQAMSVQYFKYRLDKLIHAQCAHDRRVWRPNRGLAFGGEFPAGLRRAVLSLTK